MHQRYWLATIVMLGAALMGCREESLTNEEAAEALGEAEVSGQASALTGATVEIATDFTIGEAVENAATHIRSLVESQLPCAEVTLAGATLTVRYGARPGVCVYKGQTLSGTHAITVMRNEMSEVVVRHVWTDLSNGRVEVDGNATVTWSFANPSRNVVHELTFHRISDGRMGTGSGNHTQRPLAGGLQVGFSVEGTHTWEGESGRWTLDTNQVEMRWIDPVPQAGSYVLDTPFDKTLSLSFARQAPTRIRVTIASGPKSFDFDVVTLP